MEMTNIKLKYEFLSATEYSWDWCISNGAVWTSSLHSFYMCSSGMQVHTQCKQSVLLKAMKNSNICKFQSLYLLASGPNFILFFSTDLQKNYFVDKSYHFMNNDEFMWNCVFKGVRIRSVSLIWHKNVISALCLHFKLNNIFNIYINTQSDKSAPGFILILWINNDLIQSVLVRFFI